MGAAKALRRSSRSWRAQGCTLGSVLRAPDSVRVLAEVGRPCGAYRPSIWHRPKNPERNCS
eukprot:8260417-Pyramimonas_sp.AAC.1